MYEYGRSSIGSILDDLYWHSISLRIRTEDYKNEHKGNKEENILQGNLMNLSKIAEEIVMASCGFYLALWSRLNEIGVRTAFCTLALMCARLYEELGEQMRDMIEKDEVINRECLHEEVGDGFGMFKEKEGMKNNGEELEKWKEDYEKVRCLIEYVSSSFGFVLLVFSCHDFALAIFKFADVLKCDEKIERACAFIHQLLRVLTFFAASNQVHLKAIISYCFLCLQSPRHQYFFLLRHVSPVVLSKDYRFPHGIEKLLIILTRFESTIMHILILKYDEAKFDRRCFI